MTFEQLERQRDRVDTGDKIVDIHLKALYDEIIALRFEVVCLRAERQTDLDENKAW